MSRLVPAPSSARSPLSSSSHTAISPRQPIIAPWAVVGRDAGRSKRPRQRRFHDLDPVSHCEMMAFNARSARICAMLLPHAPTVQAARAAAARAASTVPSPRPPQRTPAAFRSCDMWSAGSIPPRAATISSTEMSNAAHRDSSLVLSRAETNMTHAEDSRAAEAAASCLKAQIILEQKTPVHAKVRARLAKIVSDTEAAQQNIELQGINPTKPMDSLITHLAHASRASNFINASSCVVSLQPPARFSLQPCAVNLTQRPVSSRSARTSREATVSHDKGITSAQHSHNALSSRPSSSPPLRFRASPQVLPVHQEGGFGVADTVAYERSSSCCGASRTCVDGGTRAAAAEGDELAEPAEARAEVVVATGRIVGGDDVGMRAAVAAAGGKRPGTTLLVRSEFRSRGAQRQPNLEREHPYGTCVRADLHQAEGQHEVLRQWPHCATRVLGTLRMNELI